MAQLLEAKLKAPVFAAQQDNDDVNSWIKIHAVMAALERVVKEMEKQDLKHV